MKGPLPPHRPGNEALIREEFFVKTFLCMGGDGRLGDEILYPCVHGSRFWRWCTLLYLYGNKRRSLAN